MSRIIIHKRAVKFLRKLPEYQKEKIKNSLRVLENNPLGFSGLKNMVGEWTGYYRIRLGDIRVIFWFDETQDIVYVDYIGFRGDVYK